MKQGANCPQCGGQFSKLKNRKCPHCGVGLTLRSYKEGQKQVNQYVLTEPPKEAVEPITTDGFIFGRLNSVKGDKEWVVYVSLLVQTLYCPECGRAALWFPDLRGGSVSHKCDKCKTITVYKFKL